MECQNREKLLTHKLTLENTGEELWLVQSGRNLGHIKSSCPLYGEFYETRHPMTFSIKQLREHSLALWV